MRTGRFRFVRNWFGQQVLQVEVRTPIDQCLSGWLLEWIRGTASDATTICESLGNQMKCATPNEITEDKYDAFVRGFKAGSKR